MPGLFIQPGQEVPCTHQVTMVWPGVQQHSLLMNGIVVDLTGFGATRMGLDGVRFTVGIGHCEVVWVYV